MADFLWLEKEMNLSDLNQYPEYPSNELVEQFCNLALDQAGSEIPEKTLSNLGYLGDKLWHTYELPSKELQERIRKWLIQNWTSNSNTFLEKLLVVCYYFALDKDIFQKALDAYSGAHRREFELALEKSKSDNIDPWWSFKTTTNHQTKPDP